MRIVEWSGRPVGDTPTDAGGSQSLMGQQSQVLGPAADQGSQGHHLGSLLDPFAARQARQRAHAADLAEAGGTGGIRGAVKLGGRHAATDLGERLGDDWLLVHGVYTTAGPINQLLLGPPGLVALTTLRLLRVERVVLIHHPGPGEDQWHRPTVHAFGSTFDFLTWLHKLPKILDRGQKRQVEKLILSGDGHHPQGGAGVS